jgi:hypothetical protein
MYLTIAAILIALWLLGFLALKVAGTLIHILILLAVVALIVHLFKKSRTV